MTTHLRTAGPVAPDRRGRGARPDAEGYRGPDRRAGAGSGPPPGVRRFRASAVAALVFAAAAAGMGIGTSLDPAVAGRLTTAASDASATLAAVAAALLFLRWRLSGQTRAAVSGVVVALLFTLHPALSYLATLAGSGRGAVVWADTATVIVVLALLVIELRTPPIDTRRRPLRMSVATGVCVLAVAGALRLVFGPASWTGVGLSATVAGPPATGRTILLIALLGVLGMLLGGLLLARARVVDVDRWLGLALLLWGWAKLLTAVYAGHRSAVVGAASLHLVGMAILVSGALEGFITEIVHQGSALFDTRLSALVTTARHRVLRTEQRSRAHDARSLIMAVQTATSALESLPSLSADDRAALAGIVESGLRQLEEYVKGPSARPATVALADLAGTVARWAREAGTPIAVAVPDGITVRIEMALAREVLRAMFDHVVLGGTALLLTGNSDRGEAHLRLAPDPSAPAAAGAAPPPRSVGPDEPGPGGDDDAAGAATIDLVVLSALLATEGGGLTVERAAEAGAIVSVRLPLAETSEAGLQVVADLPATPHRHRPERPAGPGRRQIA